jgi:hypothetical protein
VSNNKKKQKKQRSNTFFSLHYKQLTLISIVMLKHELSTTFAADSPSTANDLTAALGTCQHTNHHERFHPNFLLRKKTKELAFTCRVKLQLLAQSR